MKQFTSIQQWLDETTRAGRGSLGLPAHKHQSAYQGRGVMELARELGVGHSSISYHLKRYGDLTRLTKYLNKV